MACSLVPPAFYPCCSLQACPVLPPTFRARRIRSRSQRSVSGSVVAAAAAAVSGVRRCHPCFCFSLHLHAGIPSCWVFRCSPLHFLSSCFTFVSAGGGGGGGGSGGGGFNFGDWFDGFKRGASGLLKTIGTILLFAAALGALALWQPLLRLLGRLVRMVLRLDGNPRAQMARQQALPQVRLLGLARVVCHFECRLAAEHLQAKVGSSARW